MPLMTLCTGPRHLLPDEEPEIDYISEGYTVTTEAHGYCSWCGQRGHVHDACPHRPTAHNDAQPVKATPRTAAPRTTSHA